MLKQPLALLALITWVMAGIVVLLQPKVIKPVDYLIIWLVLLLYLVRDVFNK